MTIIKANFGDRKVKQSKETEKKEPAPIYQFHVSLSFSEPRIWRRIQVPGELTLKQFHQVLQICMGWSGEYNHQFYVGKVFYDMSASTSKKSYHEADYDLQSLEEAIKWCFTYMYDAGDGWEHEIVLEDSFPPQSGDTTPRILDGEWASPPEEIGSVHVYEEFVHAIENPDDEKSVKIIQQHNLPDFDPSIFDSDELNTKLQQCNLHI